MYYWNWKTFNLAGEYLKRTGVHLRHHRVLCGVQHYQVLWVWDSHVSHARWSNREDVRKLFHFLKKKCLFIKKRKTLLKRHGNFPSFFFRHEFPQMNRSEIRQDPLFATPLLILNSLVVGRFLSLCHWQIFFKLISSLRLLIHHWLVRYTSARRWVITITA